VTYNDVTWGIRYCLLSDEGAIGQRNDVIRCRTQRNRSPPEQVMGVIGDARVVYFVINAIQPAAAYHS